jgi:hypothetical protein
MSETPPQPPPTQPHTAPPARSTVPPARRAAGEPTGWIGWVFFAGFMLVLTGVFQAIDGVVALVKDDYYRVRPSGLVVNVDYTAWGWTHLVMGVLLVLVGAALVRGQTWARVVAIILAILSAIVNFAFMPAYPIWSILVIGLDVLVIYALAAHGGELRAARGREYY